MNNNDTVISKYIKNNLSPTDEEKAFITDDYKFLKNAISGSFFQSGSYSRFTAITPVHDLDIIWIVSQDVYKTLISGELSVDIYLARLSQQIEIVCQEAGRKVYTKLEQHSITVSFVDRSGAYKIDLVPAEEIDELNKYNDHFYTIPESGHEDEWIKTDPKGYKKQAQVMNEQTPTYRKTVKLLKGWKRAWKDKQAKTSTEFKLKSFHIELLVLEMLKQNGNISVLELAKKVLSDMPNSISHPSLPDLAQSGDNTRYIDQYVADLSNEEKNVIAFAIQCGVVALDKALSTDSDISTVYHLDSLTHGEEFIEAYGYKYTRKTVEQGKFFQIDGEVQKKQGFPDGLLRKTLSLRKGMTKKPEERKIKFKVTINNFSETAVYWKVRNKGKEALRNNQIRGEINKGNTLVNPETTAFSGTHSVEAYLVNENTKEIIALDNITVPVT